MKKINTVLYYLLVIFSVLIVVGSILSVFRNTPSHFLKILDFPRIQFFIIAVISLTILVLMDDKKNWLRYTLLIGLGLAIAIQGTYILNYTPIVAKSVPDASGDLQEEDIVSLLIVNVKMSNRNEQPMINLVNRLEPDLVLAMEVDEWWGKALEPVAAKYPYSKAVLNDLTYGMSLYSKFPFKDLSVNYFTHENVPSFSATLTLENEKDIHLHTVHPPPPLNYEHLPDNKGEKEKTLTKVGDLVEQSPLPSIVAGDFNDVAWSSTEGMTRARNQLKDVRVGRGFFNSFNAKNFLMRWPLDHVFVTKEFSLNRIERLPGIESDHFPILVELAL